MTHHMYCVDVPSVYSISLIGREGEREGEIEPRERGREVEREGGTDRSEGGRDR